MRYSHVLGAAVIGLAAASAAQATLSVQLVKIPTPAGAQAADPSGLPVDQVRTFDLVVTESGADVWASGDLQVGLVSTKPGSFYNPVAGGNAQPLTPYATANLGADTWVTTEARFKANSGDTNGVPTVAVIGLAQYPVAAGPGAAQINSGSINVGWGDPQANSRVLDANPFTAARFTMVGYKGAVVKGRVGATNNTASATFDGSATPLTFSVPLLGDINDDGTVDFLDINPFVAVLSSSPTTRQTWAGDFTGDNSVDFLDINGFVASLSVAGPVPEGLAASIGAMVPEPTTSTLAAAAVLGMASRRRRS